MSSQTPPEKLQDNPSVRECTPDECRDVLFAEVLRCAGAKIVIRVMGKSGKKSTQETATRVRVFTRDAEIKRLPK